MLIFICGTGGDADDRDVIQGNFGCPNPFKHQNHLNHIFKYPGSGQSPALNQSPKATLKTHKSTKNILRWAFCNLMIGESAHHYKTKNIRRCLF